MAAGGGGRTQKIAATNTTQQRQERSPMEKKILSLSEAFQGSETPIPVVLIASLFRSFTFAWISSFSSALMRTPALNEERRMVHRFIKLKKILTKFVVLLTKQLGKFSQKKVFFLCKFG
jgi:hypothetical protein